MKTKLFAAAIAALTLGVSLPAAAQNFDRDNRGGYEQNRDGRGGY
jgi:hypothetical protein